MLEFNVDTGNGVHTYSSNDLLRHYADYSGLQPVGVSQDGASGIYQTPNGIQTIPFHEALQAVGAKITSYRPLNPVVAPENLRYRRSLDAISDPDIQQAYLQNAAIKDFGIEKPLIIGEGLDKFLWNPKEGQWVALANQKGLDLGDIQSGATSLAKGALSVAGGIGGAALGTLAGAPTGPAAVATGIAGAGLGSAMASGLADTTQAGIIAALDPSYREAYGSAKNWADKEGGNIVKGMAISGAGGALVPAAGAAFRGLAAPLKATMSPLSSVAQGTGKAVSGAGKMVNATGQALGTDLGRAGLQMGLDPTGISGIGALGGLAKDIASPIAQGGVKAADLARKGIASLRNLEGPVQSFAGDTWAETAKNFPQIGQLVKGVEGLGGGLEKVGRGVENTISGGLRGAGWGLDVGGQGLQALGKGASYLEQPAYLAAIKEQASKQRTPTLPTANEQMMQYTGAPQQNPGYTPSLMDAIRSSGGLQRLL